MMTRNRFRTRQAGIALPVMMIMLTVMMLSSIYLLRASTSTTLTTNNLAYDSAMAKAADLGLHTAFQYLSTTPKSTLLADVPAAGYVSTMVPNQTVNSAAFWAGKASVDDGATPPNHIEYVIHRMCMFQGAYNAVGPANNCTLTAAKPKVASSSKLGESLGSDTPVYDGMPELHYVVTARIVGARGGNVITQAVVMMGP